MMKTATKTNLEQRARELSTTWVLVATNQGTYGAAEACRKVGTGDPRHADCNIYEQVGTGKRRVEGCDFDRAPGYMRRFNSELADRQRELKELRTQIKAAK